MSNKEADNENKLQLTKKMSFEYFPDYNYENKEIIRLTINLLNGKGIFIEDLNNLDIENLYEWMIKMQEKFMVYYG